MENYRHGPSVGKLKLIISWVFWPTEWSMRAEICVFVVLTDDMERCYSFEYAIGTGIVGGSRPCPTTLSTTGGKLPDIATNGARCGGITDWYARSSDGLKVHKSLQIMYTSRTRGYVVITSELGTSGGVGHNTGPTACALS
ncbi:hypothetical protein BPAE_0028g00220 [Botrytis paeoniae]|uniref:Uncharacterized protein n=1 Tax=Botrytis paeoniae TaxID=278948 RepID=A0A4Z1FV34_9HELO|nr:hypothetical protein BPAE_0028g00220 [Botrytis paeoniae]